MHRIILASLLLMSPAFAQLTQTGPLQGPLQVGSSPPTACGSAVGCWGLSEGSTATTPAAGQDACRADSVTHTIKCTVNGGLETTLSTVSAQVTVPASAGTTYYVDNVGGSDSNNGTSQSTAWKTIAHVNAATIASGAQVLFLSTDVWHEQLSPSTGVTYGAYGPFRSCLPDVSLAPHCTNLPIIDASDAVTGWSVQSGANYRAAYTSTAAKGYVDALYQPQATPLVLTTSISLVTSTAGTIFSDGTNVYVHLLDGSNPANHTIEVAGARSYGVLGGGKAFTIDGLEIIRAIKGGVFDNSAVTGVVVKNSVFFNIGDSSNGGFMGAVYASLGDAATGWTVLNNLFGVMDFPDSQLSSSQGAISFVANGTGLVIQGNKIATIHGNGISLLDGFSGTCAGGLITGNEITNGEGNMYISGCSSVVISNNNIHDSTGNIEITSGIQSTTPTGIIIQANKMTNLGPAYSNSQYNCIDVNPSTGGYAIANVVSKCAAANMTLEGASNSWTIVGNTFDATNNTSSTGGTVSGLAPAYPMFLSATGTYTSMTMRGNNLLFNPIFGLIRWGAADGSKDLSQVQFDALFPGFEIPAPILAASGNSFSVAGCGTATSLTNGTLVGSFTGGSSTCTPVITTGVTSRVGYACNMQDSTTATANFRQTGRSTTTATFTAEGTVGGTDQINFSCTPF